MLDLCDQVRFALEASPKNQIILEIDGHYLNGYISAKVRIMGQVNSGHSASTNLRLNFVSCDRFSNHLKIPRFGGKCGLTEEDGKSIQP